MRGGRLNHSVLHGLGDRFGFGVDLKLLVDVANVIANCVEADKQSFPDHGIIESFRK